MNADERLARHRDQLATLTASLDARDRALVMRCDGSGQRTLMPGRALCPVCGQRVNVETRDGVLVLVEHRPTPRGAEPVTLGMFA